MPKEELTVEIASMVEYDFYIAPEHVIKGKDYKLPEVIYFNIYFDNEAVTIE